MAVIGISLGYRGLETDKLQLKDDYLYAVKKAGGIPVLLTPLTDERNFGRLIEIIDGFLLSGGGDVDPRFFGKRPQPELGRIDPRRDNFELGFLAAVLENKLPVLALCRGIQVLNIECGGSVIQHLTTSLKHFQEAPGYYGTHEVYLHKSGYLQKFFNSCQFRVNSFHHQAVGDTGEGLEVAARAADGTIEAIVMPDYPFAVGLQWHPERMLNADPLQMSIFSHFVAACSG